MSEEKLIQFVNTKTGEKKYDYTALGNLPVASNYKLYSEGNLPLPSEEYHGDIAFVYTSSGAEKILPHICLKRRGKYVWHSFALKAEERIKIAKPFIQLYKDKLDKPNIILDVKKLESPNIYLDIKKLESPNIHLDIDFTPAILGEAILGYCYLGEKENV